MNTLVRDPRTDQAKVWRIWLEQPPSVIGAMRGVLALDELRRANRLRREVDRRRFIVAHGALRMILSDHIGQAPPSLPFTTTPTGKPSLGNGEVALRLRFNLSHSGNWAVVVLADSRDVGIDIELVDPSVRVLAVAKRAFSPRELRRLQRLPEVDRIDQFFRMWVRREAYAKALGEGIGAGLPRLDLAESCLPPGCRIDDCSSRRSWTLFDVNVAGGYACAVVVEGAAQSLQIDEWSPGGETSTGIS